MSCSHGSSIRSEYDASQIDSRLYYDSLDVVRLFVLALNERNFSTLVKTVNPIKMTFEGIRYMPSQTFLYTCLKITENTKMSLKNLTAYSFDEAENPTIKPSALKMFRVFDNESMLIISELEFYNNITRYTRQLLFVVSRDRDNPKKAQINAVCGFDNQPQYIENFDRRYEIIEPFGICINIPKDFSTEKIDRTLINFYLEDKSSYKAAFQIFAVKSNNIQKAAMNYIKQIVKQQDFYDLTIKYLPDGYRFRFYIKDSSYKPKIMKINVIQNKNKLIFITFSADKQLYDDRQYEINYCLDNIDIIK